MRKILFVDISPKRGGAEVSLERLLERIGDSEDMTVLVPSCRSGILNFHGASAKRVEIESKILTESKTSFSAILCAFLIFFKGFSIKCSQDIIVTNTFKSHILGFGMKIRNQKSKWVIYERDVPENIFVGILKKKLYLFCDYVIFNSLFLKEKCKGGSDSEVIYNLIDKKYDGGERDFRTLLFVGNLTYEKGFDRALEVFAGIRKKIPEAKLLAAGESGYGHPVPLKKGEGVEYIGYDREREYLKRAGIILLFNRRRESFSRAVAEAMMSGAAAAILSGNGMDDYADDSNSIKFNYYDPLEIAAKIIETIEGGKVKEIAERGRASVRNLLNGDESVRRLRSIFDRISP